jgi:hypothetical protein
MLHGARFLVIRLVRTLCDCMVNSPLANLRIVPTHMGGCVVRPGVAIIEGEAEGEDVDVTLAHHKLAEGVDAVVEMAVEIVLWRGCIATELAVVRFVRVLSQQVQAVELMEDFNGHPEAALSRCGVCDLERAVGVESHLNHLLSGYHRVTDWFRDHLVSEPS